MNNENTTTAPGPELTIWHTFELGTILSGTRKGDIAARMLGRGGLGWRWSPNITTPDGEDGAWYIRASRDKPPDRWRIQRDAERLREAGCGVTIHIDNTPRDVTDAEADRDTRTRQRAEALRGKAERQHGKVEALREQAVACFPDNGQPLLVDHYSYTADLNRRERGWKKLQQAHDLDATARETGRRAAAAQHSADLRQGPMSVARRIRDVETKLRSWQRELAGGNGWYRNHAGEEVFGHVDPSPDRAQQARDHIAHLEQQLAYWRNIRHEQIAAGVATDYGPADITVGDFVQYGGDWYEVTRVNRKSVTVRKRLGNSGNWTTGTVPYDQIADHRSKADTNHAEDD